MQGCCWFVEFSRRLRPYLPTDHQHSLKISFEVGPAEVGGSELVQFFLPECNCRVCVWGCGWLGLITYTKLPHMKRMVSTNLLWKEGDVTLFR